MTGPGATADTHPPAACPARRRWRQFSLRTALLAMLVLGVLFGLFAIRRERARRQAAAVATIRTLGGEVYYDFEIRPNVKPGVVPHSSVPNWLLARLGPDFFHDVGQVNLGPAALPTPQENVNRCWAAISQLHNLDGIYAYRDWINRQAIETISRQKRLRRLLLREQNLVDSDLEPLGNLKHLESLDLEDTTIGDEGARYLSNFLKLQTLSLKGTRIGDDGVAQIAAAATLQYLFLDNTDVGDRGAAEITKLKSLKRLALNETNLSDSGLSHLARLAELQWLEINETNVTGTGFRDFPPDSHLAQIRMRKCPVSDEGMLAIGRFRRLESLFVDGPGPTAVTMVSLGQIEWPSSVENIRLRGSGLNDEGLMRFVDCPKLWQIGITGTKVTPEGARRFRAARPTVNVVGP